MQFQLSASLECGALAPLWYFNRYWYQSADESAHSKEVPKLKLHHYPHSAKTIGVICGSLEMTRSCVSEDEYRKTYVSGLRADPAVKLDQ